MPQGPDNVAAVLKVFSILEGLGGQRSISLSELSQRTSMPKSTAYRFLHTMKELGYVSQDEENEKYALTLKLFELGASALQNVDLITAADAEMRKLSDITHEAIHLGTLDTDRRDIIYIHKYDSQYNLCMQSRIGHRNPVYSTAIGKTLLAWMSDDQARNVLGNINFESRTPHTLTSVEAVMAEMPLIREQGVAEDREEAELGVRCMAVPILDRFGNAVAAMSMSFPVVRYDEQNRKAYIELLHRAAMRISKTIGFHNYMFSALTVNRD